MYYKRVLRKRKRAIRGGDEARAAPAQAVALGYDPEKDSAPRVLAAGNGALAERILALAREHGVPIQEDPVLVEALATVDLGASIPAELYVVVAEVLAFVYRVQGKRV
jgi:flagellar biosynthesis protein